VHVNIQSLRQASHLLIVTLLAVVAVTGCSQVEQKISRPSSTVEYNSKASATEAVPSGSASDLSLNGIINHDLQNGRYEQGERDLRQYLQAHPGDRLAQSLLHQLTVDPQQMLGNPVRTHTVQSGESYSTLAGQYLGDSTLFLVLARYNGSANPSLLRAGTTLRLPAAPDGSSQSSPGLPAPPPVNAISNAQKAIQLRDQSIALYQQGQKQQAVAFYGQALILDPHLPASGDTATALRDQVVTNYHQQAIVLYRDQQLDQAIALWDRILAINPDYEPAQIYRARALELKKRLQQY
jgi:tetratricopeptide (TPR) repeat protein